MIIVRAVVAKEKPEKFTTNIKNSMVVWYDYANHNDIAWANIEEPDVDDKRKEVHMWEKGFERALEYFNVEYEFVDLCFEDENWDDYGHVRTRLEEELYG